MENYTRKYDVGQALYFVFDNEIMKKPVKQTYFNGSFQYLFRISFLHEEWIPERNVFESLETMMEEYKKRLG